MNMSVLTRSLIRNQISRRCLSVSAKDLPNHRALVLDKYGEPEESLKLHVRSPEEIITKALEPKQILVKHLVASINPADINVAQGVYGVKADLGTPIGNEGITEVLDVGSEVKHVKPGDWALGVTTFGYWQSYSLQNADDFYKIDNNLDVISAAQLRVNPCTAYRMVKDYRSMQPGDVLLQNGANSAVGVYAIQLAKHMGLKSINVIRDRPNKCDIIKELKDFGADYVITEEELRNVEVITPILKMIGKPKLFLNCVSGKNASNCLRILDNGGVSVTYGFMSKQPLMIGAQSMFKDHQIKFFWMSKWYTDREPDRRNEICGMLDELSQMFKAGTLKPKASTLISFEDRNQAFSGSNNTKYMFAINVQQH